MKQRGVGSPLTRPLPYARNRRFYSIHVGPEVPSVSSSILILAARPQTIVTTIVIHEIKGRGGRREVISGRELTRRVECWACNDSVVVERVRPEARTQRNQG